MSLVFSQEHISLANILFKVDMLFLVEVCIFLNFNSLKNICEITKSKGCGHNVSSRSNVNYVNILFVVQLNNKYYI